MVGLHPLHRKVGLSLLAMGFAAIVASETGFARKTGLAFEVLRDGSQLGSHEIEFRHHGDELHVKVAIDLEVALGFITLFRYEHSNHEIWRNGRLISIETRTDDDGETFHVSGRATAEGFVLRGSQGRIVAPHDVVPSSYWHPKTIEQVQLLDTQRGRLVDVRVDALGHDIVEDSTLEVASRYRMSGDLNLDLWYDDKGEWRKLAFTARGSDVVYTRSASPGYADLLADRRAAKP